MCFLKTQSKTVASGWWFRKLTLLILTINSSKDVSLNIGPSCKLSLRLTQLPIPEGYRNEIAKKWRLQLKPFTNYRLNGFIWLVVLTIFPYIGNNHPNWLSYFSEGLKPPTSLVFNVSKKPKRVIPVPWFLMFAASLQRWNSDQLSVSCIQATI